MKESVYNLQNLPVAEKDGLGNETGFNYTLDGQVKDVIREAGIGKERSKAMNITPEGK